MEPLPVDRDEAGDEVFRYIQEGEPGGKCCDCHHPAEGTYGGSYWCLWCFNDSPPPVTAGGMGHTLAPLVADGPGPIKREGQGAPDPHDHALEQVGGDYRHGGDDHEAGP